MTSEICENYFENRKQKKQKKNTSKRESGKGSKEPYWMVS